MKETAVLRTSLCDMLGIRYPICLAGMGGRGDATPSALVAAVSNAGGLGILHPTAGIEPGGDIVANVQANVRRVQRLTQNPFGVALYLPNPQIEEIIEAAVQEGGSSAAEGRFKLCIIL